MLLDNNLLKNIDTESIIFWRNGCPSLDFKETDVITFKGDNILHMRPEIETSTMLKYINAYYRHFPAESFIKIIKESSESQIRKLSYVNTKMPLVVKNDVQANKVKSLETIPFNYAKSKEIGTFHKQNTIKILAYLVLAEKYEKHRIPIDLIEANIFFKENFNGDKREVFERCCTHHDLNSEEVLLNYSSSIKSINYYALYNSPKNKNKSSTIDVLLNVFSQITK